MCTVACDVGYEPCNGGTACCSCGDTQNDPHNCGYCGHDCQGATCSGGTCQPVVIATMQANAFAIAADDVNVYWTVQGTGGNGAVMQAPIAGGAAVPLAKPAPAYPSAIAVSGSTVYWVDSQSVLSIPVGGGAQSTLAPGQYGSYAIAADVTGIYWTDYPYMSPGSVFASSPAGSPPRLLAGGQSQPMAITVHGGKVYFADQVDLMVVDAGGGGSAAPFAAGVYPYSVAADDHFVYFGAGMNGGEVIEEPVGGGAQVVLAKNQYYPDAIAVDADSVYFATGEGGSGTVMRVPIAGGTPVALATGQAYPTGIAINSTRVFWVNFGNGTINSVPK
jgi:hypothetical protein